MRSKGSAQPSSSNNHRRGATGVEGENGEATKQQLTGNSDESESIQRKPINIVVQTVISSLTLLADGQRFLSGDKNGKIRCWRIEDGEEMGMSIDAGSPVSCVAASQDGSWIVAGTESGQVVVWAAGTGQKVKTFTYEKRMNSVDVSSDGTKIAMAADDKIVSVYPLLDGKKLCGWKDWDFHMVKFSPQGFFLAIGAEQGESSLLSVYDTRGDQLLGTRRTSARSIAWTSDSKQLFALSSDGDIQCVDPYSLRTILKWPIHSTDNPTCISLSSNGAFIAASANASISFWDTLTHEQIGFVIHYPGPVDCMTVSSNFDLLIGGSPGITLWDLHGVLSTPHIDHQVSRSPLPKLRPFNIVTARNPLQKDSIAPQSDNQRALHPAHHLTARRQTEGR